MQNTSTTYDTIWSGSAPHNVELKVVINGVEYQQSQILSLRTTRSLFDEGVPKVGSATSSELDLTIIKPSATIPTMAKIVPWFRIKNAESQSEWLPIGIYYVDTRESTNYGGGYDTLTLHCYDSMLRLDVSASNVASVGTSVLTVLNEINYIIFQNRQASLDTSILDVYNSWSASFGIYSLPTVSNITDKTARDLLKEIGSLLGCNFYIKSFVACGIAGEKLACHKLGTIPVSEESFLIDEGNNILTFGDTNILLSAGSTQSLGQSMMDYNEAPQLLPFGKVYVNSYYANASGYSPQTHRTLSVEIECFGTNFGCAMALLQSVNNYAYQPYTAINAVLNPASELGDVITANGKTSIVAVIETDWDSLSLATVSAPCDEEMNHEYQYTDPVERAVDSKVTLGQSYNGTTISSSGITAQGNGFVLKDGDGNNAIVYNSTTRKFTFNGSIEIADGSISFAKLDSTAQYKANYGLDLANGIAAGGSFISNKAIYSPIIFANDFVVYPDLSTNTNGCFDIRGVYNGNYFDMFKIEYDGSSFPEIYLGSPNGANINIGLNKNSLTNSVTLHGTLYMKYGGTLYSIFPSGGYLKAVAV